MGRALVASVLCILLSGLVVDADARQLWYNKENLTEEEAARIWLEEIVPYIITDGERETFEGLETPEQRARFIEQFWRRRDPDPRTPENEFLHEHIKRIVQANRLFGSARHGWRTDRGRIYILLGPPDSVESDPMGYSAHQHPTETWIYFNPPHSRLPARLAFNFVDDNFDSEYDLTFDMLADSDTTGRTEALLGDDFLDPLVQAEIMANNLGRAGVFQTFRERRSPELAGIENLSVVEQLPELTLDQPEPAVTASVTFTDLFSVSDRRTIDHGIGFFRTAEGDSYLPVTLGLSYDDFKTLGPSAGAGGEGPEEGSFAVMARIVDETGTPQDAFVREEYFRIPAGKKEEAGEADLMYEVTLYAPPGKYDLEVVVQDRLNGRAFSFKEPVRVPDYGDADRLALSSVVVAKQIVSLGRSENPAVKQPFTFGEYRVIPNLGGVFRSDDTLDVYFEAYNLARDESGRNSVAVQYTFRREGRLYRRNRTYPAPAPVDHMALASSIGLSDFEAGRYTLEVTITDEVAGASTSAEVPFEVR